MLEKIKFALKVIFTTPKPKIKETEYKIERKSFRLNYDKYYTKKEKFTLIMWSFSLIFLTGEVGIYTFFLYNDIMRWLLLGALIFFFIIDKKYLSRTREKYKEKALKEGSYG